MSGESPPHATEHPQVRIVDRGRSAWVDEELAPLLLALWRRGFRTISSCQHEAGTLQAWEGLNIICGAAWIGFETRADAERFHEQVQGSVIVEPNAEDYAEASGESVEA